jgi:DNA-binding transcriptional ArsR family regulator
MSQATEYARFLAEKGRLVILQALAAEFNGHLGDELLQKAVDLRLVARSIEWVRTQLAVLEELGAITLERDGERVIAGLTSAGRDHIDRRRPLAGVAWPEDEG